MLQGALAEAIERQLAALPPEERIEALRLLREELGDVLTGADGAEAGVMTHLRVRAELAAAPFPGVNRDGSPAPDGKGREEPPDEPD